MDKKTCQVIMVSGLLCGRLIHKHEKCIFHLEYEDNAKNEFFEKEFWKEFERLEKSNETNELDFSKFIFPKRISFEGRLFKKSVFFSEVIFSDETDFIKAQFTRDAIFSGAQFRKKADFSRVYFREGAYFSRTKFDNKAIFSQVEFANTADYFGAQFGNGAEFIATRFKSRSNFSEVNFNGKVSFGGAQLKDGKFLKCQFSNDADFGGAWIDSIDFSNSLLGKKASFSMAIFNFSADFSMAEFVEAVDFSKVEFRKKTNFSTAKFNNSINFSKTLFQEDADFTKTLFRGKSIFSFAKFDHYANFLESQFIGCANFVGVKFLKETNFSKAEFFEKADFKYCTFMSEVNFLDTKFNNEYFVNFNFCKFHTPKDVKFQNINLCNASFLYTDITEMEFLNEKWAMKNGRRTVVDESRIIDDKTITYDAVAQLYRRLRRNYELNYRFEEAGNFFIGEMEMRRLDVKPRFKNKNVKKIELWFKRNFSLLSVYKYISLYGESYYRPARCSFIIIISYPLLVHWLFNSALPDDLLAYMRTSAGSFFQMDNKYVGERIIGIPILGLLFIALKRKFERKK